MADEIFLVNSSSFQDVEISSSLRAGPSVVVDLTQASVVTGSFSGPAQGLTGVSASYIMPDTDTTASWANTASWAINAINGGTTVVTGSTVPITASWATNTSNANSSSYLIPGATFYQVSGSNGIPPAYIEPYDIPIDPYNPPFKEGRMFYDSDFHNWVYYPDLEFKLHIGKEVIWRIHNPYNTTLAATTVVYISGSTAGGLPDAYKAIADGTGTKSDVVGIIRSDIPSGSFGYLLCNGVIHDVDVGTLDVGDQVWLSPSVEGGFVDADPGQPYESIRIGTCQESGVNGSIGLNIYTQPPPANAYAGMTSIPSISDNTSSFEVFIGSGSVNLYDNADGRGAITQFPIAEATFSVTPGVEASFVYATSNGVTASYEITTNFDTITGTDKVLVTTLYRADEDAHWMQAKNEGLALANKLNTRLIETDKFAWESGFSLISTGSNYFTVTAGQVWFGATNISQEIFNSFATASVNPKYETHWLQHSESVWVFPIQQDGKWNSGYYDNGTNTASLAQNSWSCHYVYRILGENPFDEDVFLVTSNYQYASFAEAQADVLPTGVPGVLDDIALLVGRLVFQSGSTTATTETAFTTNFGQSTVTQHNSLGGLQGGQGGEYYHLKSAEYVGTGTGDFVRESSPIISGLNATGSLLGTASWANTAVSANAISFVPATASNADTASWAITSSFALNGGGGGTSLTTGSTYEITASWSINSETTSYVAATNIVGTLTATQAPIAFSASWVSASAFITTAQTASFVTASNVVGTLTEDQAPIAKSASWVSASAFITTAQTASYISASNLPEHTASWAVSASWAPVPDYTSSLWGTSSWANNAVTSSYTAITFSQGGTIYDALGIAGTAATNQNIVIWRASIPCNVVNVFGYIAGGTSSTASVNARKNGIGQLASGSGAAQSHITITGSLWQPASSILTSSFTVGDSLEIMLISSSGNPIQIAIQVDFNK